MFKKNHYLSADQNKKTLVIEKRWSAVWIEQNLSLPYFFWSQFGNLQKHKVIHGNIREFSCHLCPDKSFRHSETYKIHMKGHVLDGTVTENKYGKIYSCQYCQKQMPSASQYTVHLRSVYSITTCIQYYYLYAALLLVYLSLHSVHLGLWIFQVKFMVTVMKWLLNDPMPIFSLVDNKDLIYLISVCRATQIYTDIGLNTIGYTENIIWALFEEDFYVVYCE